MRSTVAEISTSALHHNISVIRQRAPGAALMAMVKANAYGHGMIDVAKLIEDSVDMFGVAVMCEGVTLRLARITKPIVVMMPPDIYDAEKFCECDLQMVACDMELLNDFEEEARKQNVVLKAHLYIDTGMHRDGIMPHDALNFMKQCSALRHIQVVGICTHFATSDAEDQRFMLEQLGLFSKTLDTLQNGGYDFQYIHASNSGALFSQPSAHFNCVRVGLSLYGIAPDRVEDSHLKPVLRLRTRVNAVRRISKGESVSYGRHFIAQQETTIATIPIGYGDGYSRMLSGRVQCLLNGKRYPIVGAICMDECMINVGDDAVSLGDEVVLIGTQGENEISVRELATIMNTIPYEVTTMISARVPRVMVDA